MAEFGMALHYGQAVQFQQGVRRGNPLKKSMPAFVLTAHGRMEEAVQLYKQAVQTDPRDDDGSTWVWPMAPLGVVILLCSDSGWCAGRRIPFPSNYSRYDDERPDRDVNPFLWQAFGCWEENMGDLSETEHWYKAIAQQPLHTGDKTSRS